jgi:hypothetical protein
MNGWKFGLAVAAAAMFAPVARADGLTCGYGTKVNFVDDPKQAAALAKKQEKLVLVLHVSGHFENPEFT